MPSRQERFLVRRAVVLTRSRGSIIGTYCVVEFFFAPTVIPFPHISLRLNPHRRVQYNRLYRQCVGGTRFATIPAFPAPRTADTALICYRQEILCGRKPQYSETLPFYVASYVTLMAEVVSATTTSPVCSPGANPVNMTSDYRKELAAPI